MSEKAKCEEYCQRPSVCAPGTGCHAFDEFGNRVAAAFGSGKVPEAARLVIAERERQQTVKGYHETHDDQEHAEGDLARAAACYATGNVYGWPWDLDHWKPSPDNRVRELVKAGALILAEIERLQRAAAREGQ